MPLKGMSSETKTADLGAVTVRECMSDFIAKHFPGEDATIYSTPVYQAEGYWTADVDEGSLTIAGWIVQPGEYGYSSGVDAGTDNPAERVYCEI